MKLSSKSLFRALKKSKIRQIGEAKLLEFHRNKLLTAIQAHEAKLACTGLIQKLFEEKHPGHFQIFKELIGNQYSQKNFRSGHARIYRGFVETLIKESKNLKVTVRESSKQSTEKNAA